MDIFLSQKYTLCLLVNCSPCRYKPLCTDGIRSFAPMLNLTHFSFHTTQNLELLYKIRVALQHRQRKEDFFQIKKWINK